MGCYQPNIANGGFRCQSTDNPACPHGFYCVNGYCVNQPGLNVGGDAGGQGGGSGGQGGSGGGGGAGGGGGIVSDLAVTDQPDLLATQPDLMMSNCGAAGSICTSGSQCCSGSCFLLVCL